MLFRPFLECTTITKVHTQLSSCFLFLCKLFSFSLSSGSSFVSHCFLHGQCTKLTRILFLQVPHDNIRHPFRLFFTRTIVSENR